MTFWTDAAILGAAGIPSVLFGPGGAGLHSIEEYVFVDDVCRCREALANLAKKLVSLNPGEAMSYADCRASPMSEGDTTSRFHSWAHEPQTITSTTMFVRLGTVETRRARPTASPHAGHLRSTVMWGCPRFNPGDSQMEYLDSDQAHDSSRHNYPAFSPNSARSTNPTLAGRSPSRRMKYGNHSLPNGM